MLIVFEGIDGSGKSSLTEGLQKKIANSVKFAEPSQGYWGKKIRQLLKEKSNDMQNTNEVLLELFRKDRIWNNSELIMPALEKGEDVLLDRSFFSTAAYQTYSQKQLKQILNYYLNEKLVLKPDLLVYIDIPISEALKRINKRSLDLEIFEKESELKRIKSNFDLIMKTAFSFETLILNGQLNQDRLQAKVLEAIDSIKMANIRI